MLSVEELKLLIEKLEKAKKEDLQELIDSNLKILKDIAESVDIVNRETIDRTDKTPAWFNHDRKIKLAKPFLDAGLTHMIKQKIYQLRHKK